MSLTKENYYDYREGDEIIVSNSALNHINPSQGGSPKRFMDYITGNVEKKESKSLERGRLLHSFLEDKDNFVILPEDRPSDDVCSIVRSVREQVIASGLIPGKLTEHTDLIVTTARSTGFGGNWKTDTLISKICEKGSMFFDFLSNSEGKYMTDAKSRQILDCITDGLKSNPHVWDNYILTPPGVMKEFPVLFSYDGVLCKSLLDNVFVDFATKRAVIRDIKTTSKPVGLFAGVNKYYTPDNVVFEPGAFQKYHVYRQLAFYGMALRQWLVQRGELGHKYIIDYEVLVCETIEPYEHQVFTITENWIRVGKNEVEICFSIIKNIAYGNEAFNNSATQ